MISLCHHAVRLACEGCILFSISCRHWRQEKEDQESISHHSKPGLGTREIHVVVEV